MTANSTGCWRACTMLARGRIWKKKKNPAFPGTPGAVWMAVLEPLSRGGRAQAAGNGSTAEVRLLGKCRGHRTSQRATTSLRVCWYGRPPAESPTNQTSKPEGLDLETWRASISPCKEPWPRADRTGRAVKVGLALRGKQNTGDKGWYTMALFKIIIKKKKSIGKLPLASSRPGCDPSLWSCPEGRQLVSLKGCQKI